MKGIGTPYSLTWWAAELYGWAGKLTIDQKVEGVIHRHRGDARKGKRC